jgi:TfoX/Sxy family transcriptional regulator of competence genes
MKWIQAPQGLVDTFNAVLPADRRAEPRKMFGYPCCFVGGHMFMGLYQDRMVLRLTPEDREALMAKGGVVFEPMPGRPMKEYVTVPPSVLESQAALLEWVGRSLTYGLSLPPKSKEPKTAKAAPSAPGKSPSKRRG